MDIKSAIRARRQPVQRQSTTLGCTVYVQRLSYAFLADHASSAEGGVLLVAQGIVSAEGEPIFADAAAVRELDTDVLADLARLVSEVNNFGALMEQAEKNSPPPPSTA